jgi:hypothetical protein
MTNVPLIEWNVFPAVQEADNVILSCNNNIFELFQDRAKLYFQN